MDTTKPQPDLQALALTKAIRATESGGNYKAVGDVGTSSGAYQYQPNTWKQYSKEVLGVDNAPMTPENQNAVTYGKIKTWKDSGMGPAEIAAAWNAGEGKAKSGAWTSNIGVNKINGVDVPYNTPEYAKKVVDSFKQLYPQVQQQYGGQVSQVTQPTEQPVPTTNFGVLFPSSPTDSPLMAGAKTLGNVLPSAWNFAKGALNAINPINTIRNLSEIPSATKDLITGPGDVGSKLSGLAQGAYESLVPEAGRALISGNTQKAQELITNDPVGQIAPFLLMAEGGLKGVDSKMGTNYAKSFDTGISTTAKTVTKPLKPVIEAGSNLLGSITKSAASHVTGLDSKTISNIFSNPEAFSKLQQDQVSRGGLANEVGNAIDNLSGKLDESGSLYQPIRESANTVVLPENFFKNILDKYKIKLEPIISEIKQEKGIPTIQMEAPKPSGYKVVTDTNSYTRNPSDIKAIQNFIDTWGNKESLNHNEFLNMRKDANITMAKFGKDIGSNADAKVIGTDIYSKLNETVRPQIKGLQNLDSTYAPLRQQYDAIKKDFLQKDPEGGYVFKDGAVKKIANALGSGKENLLSRMEQLMPGITKKIEILKAVEDIEKAKSIKVGTYTRGAIEGFGLLTGNVPAIVGAIITNPTFAVPIIRGLGLSASKVAPIVSSLKMIAGDINHLKLPNIDKTKTAK